MPGRRPPSELLVAQKLKPLPFYPAIPEVGFVRAQGQAVGLDRPGNFCHCGLRLFYRLFHALAEDDEVVRVAHHALTQPSHVFVEASIAGLR